MPFEELPKDRSLIDPLPESPLELIAKWLDDAKTQEVQPNPAAMTLATVDANGRPAARMVLCRGYDGTDGFLVFYTDRRSRKGSELDASPRAAAVFHWDVLARQIRIDGPVLTSPDTESDAYFASRERLSQIAAWASEQSQPVDSRAALLSRLAEKDESFSGYEIIPRPPYWGGYRLFIEKAELWVGSQGRAHDRALWTRALTKVENKFVGGKWAVTRLQS